MARIDTELAAFARQCDELGLAYEREDWGRIGLEAYYTGRQELDDDAAVDDPGADIVPLPNRTKTRS